MRSNDSSLGYAYLLALGIALLCPVGLLHAQGPEPLRPLGQVGSDRLKLGDQFDVNGDGFLDKYERIEARKEVHAIRKKAFVDRSMQNDQNGDGVLSGDELQSGSGRGFRRGPSLDRADANGDGKVDAQEIGELIYQSRSRELEGRNFEAAERLSPQGVFERGSGLYDEGTLRTFFFQFDDDHWMEELQDFYRTDVPVRADLIVDGQIYHNVGVRYRGNSSFFTVPPQLKRSLDVQMDYGDSKQRLHGYKTLNLLNAHEDPTLMREVLYSRICREYIPAFRANFVKVVLNGESWGIYPNVQQYNSDFLQDWYGSRKGVRWEGSGSLTYEGPDVENYSRYTLKSGNASDQSWKDLVELCRVLDQVQDDQLEKALHPIFDIDGALWSIALENVFVDEGYLIRGSDYNLFQDGQRRFHLLQHDGNEVFNRPGGPGMPRDMVATELPPYYEADTKRRPVVGRLLSIPHIRARYTAHMRTIISQWLNWEKVGPLVEQYRQLIDLEVRKDVRLESSYQDFVDNIESTVQGRVLGLKEFVELRRNFLLSHPELTAPAPEIISVSIDQKNGPILAGQSVNVRVQMSSANAAEHVVLHYAGERHAAFGSVALVDDGRHGDGGVRDGVFGGVIPAMPVHSLVHYYVEARSSTENPVTSFYPERAEAGALVYSVRPDLSMMPAVVISEIMSQNIDTVADPKGEHDDWIELHNSGSQVVEVGGMYLTDDVRNPRKYMFPKGTTIKPGAYLLVWADEDGKDVDGLHANFKLSAEGETIRLIDADARGNRMIDQVVFGSIAEGQSWARMGSNSGFKEAQPTPGTAN